MKAYRIRRVNDGKYANGVVYGTRTFFRKEKGKTWYNKSHIHMHLKGAFRANVHIYDGCVMEEFVFVEKKVGQVRLERYFEKTAMVNNL